MSLRNLFLNLVLLLPVMVSNSVGMPFSRNASPAAAGSTGTARQLLPQVLAPELARGIRPVFPSSIDFLPPMLEILDIPAPAVDSSRFEQRLITSRTDLKPSRLPLGWMPAPNFEVSVQVVVGPVGAPSQGTVTCLPDGGLAIVTHDHFHSPSLDSRDDLYFKGYEDEYFTGHVDIRTNRPESTRFDEVNIIPMSETCTGRIEGAAEMAAPGDIEKIRIGDWVQVVYNAGTERGEFILKYASMQVIEISGTTIQVHDPDRLINKGDSGGAVYFDGKLIGVLWSIADYSYGPGVNVSLLTTEIR